MKSLKLLLFGGLLTISFLVHADPVGTAFTYQGELQQLGQLANGSYDFEFGLFDVESGESAVATKVQKEGVVVGEGVFTVELDFGTSPFVDQKLWLEVGVRNSTSEGGYTVLSPRQTLNPTPFALFALSGNEGPDGPKGDVGPQGVQGDVGPQGAQGVAGPQISGQAGIQESNFSGSITSTTWTEIERITIDSTSTFDVSLTAHVVLEANVLTGTPRYEISIKKGSTAGATVGRGWWRPMKGFQASTVSLTGYESDVNGPQDYVLCAKQYDNDAPVATIGPRGLNALWFVK
jgi:hypothetical protein